MKKFLTSFLLLCLAVCSFDSIACTSVIISGKATVSGKPLMLKHRDTGELNNRMEYFRGPIYSFIGLVNSNSEGGEVWSGTNNAGFCIMNTASYNLNYDDVPEDEMDNEGRMMFRALGMCAKLSDFEKFLDGQSKPYGVEANFGVIDASGGAAYYEVGNYGWKKYDVNEIPCGYRVVTNFSESGRREDYKGYERYLTAQSIMSEMYSDAIDGKMDIGPHDLFYNISRSYRNEMVGIDYLNDYYNLKSKFGFTGIVPDIDFIPRSKTSAEVVFEGVRAGEDPRLTVMWTVLGYPCCSVTIPLMVGDSDMIPPYLKRSDSSENAWMCDVALKLKNDYVFTGDQNNYVNLNNVMDFLHRCLVTESMIEGSWQELYGSFVEGKKDFQSFKSEYSIFCDKLFERYIEQFASFNK